MADYNTEMAPVKRIGRPSHDKRDDRRLFLTFVELDMAVGLWRLGLDTYDITKKLNELLWSEVIHEAATFNALREYREKRRAAA